MASMRQKQAVSWPSVVGASSALPLAPFPRCSYSCKTACAWMGSRLAAPPGAATFLLSLHAVQARGRHDSTSHASLAEMHSRASFWRQKVCLSPVCVILSKTPQRTTHLFSLTVVSPGHHSSGFHSLGNRDRLVLYCCCCILLLCDLPLSDCKRYIFQAKLKNESACSWLHHLVLMLMSISSETDSE